jgi:hypothetical protein
MRHKRLFLKWALFASLVIIGAIVASNIGWAEHLEKDPTHITYVTFTVFCLATLWCGRLTWRLTSGRDPHEVALELKHSWFASSLCVSIGLIGTAVGYFIMLEHGHSGGEPGQVIDQAFANTSIAIINTVVGAVCGVLVEIQSHFVEVAVEKAIAKGGKPSAGAA